MSLTVSDSGGGTTFAPAPEGIHPGRCFLIIDKGTQTSNKFLDDRTGLPKKQRKVLLAWELPTQLRDDGKPHVIFEEYTASLGDKANLRKDLEAWRGKKFTKEELDGFELSKILGQTCYIGVVHSECGKYANKQSIVQLPPGVEVPDRISDLVEFDLDNPDWSLFETFSEKLQQQIKSCDELANAKATSTAQPTGDGPPRDESEAPAEDPDAPF